MLDAASARRFWSLDPAITFLNHGSFGACPTPVMEAAASLRERIEREPVRFLVAEMETLLDAARVEVSAFLGAQPEDVAFVPNATAGVSTVLASLALQPGDELLTIDHAYNACMNALRRTAARAGASVTVASVPFPTPSADAVVEAVLGRVTPRTRLALIDQVTSPTALVLPIERLVKELAACGVDTLVDAAHAPGMLPLDLDRVGAAYTTGNFHKWVCAPRAAAFLHVRRDRREQLLPLVTSHGANSPRVDRPRFWLEFDWTGTFDPVPWLSVPAALRFLASLASGGIGAVMERNHQASIAARRVLCEALDLAPPCPDEMIGSMFSLPVRDDGATGHGPFDPLQDALFTRHAIEVPVFFWPAAPHKLLRVSTPAYIGNDEVLRLVAALRDLKVTGRRS
jgi:isopenicillin-N epimerase